MLSASVESAVGVIARLTIKRVTSERRRDRHSPCNRDAFNRHTSEREPKR